MSFLYKTNDFLYGNLIFFYVIENYSSGSCVKIMCNIFSKLLTTNILRLWSNQVSHLSTASLISAVIQSSKSFISCFF
ncbi:hypothetical protein RclHR1_01910021 [Rhizophagus clarus]|uniref:Uncharacterized protein n=1 Tax=Rhizophagus clarus TaxID=94130 RepID=A0A2Z6QNM4_9GLOM|nr:hypothetical protein RclHR1_01910021 [Rhizophagus clarus]